MSAGQSRTTRFQRDKAGRLTARQLPPSDSSPTYVERLTYNRAGQLTEAHNANCAVRWHYDQAGRIRAEAQQHADGWNWRCAHRRNAFGLIEASHYGEAPAIDWLTYGPGHLHGIRIGEQSLDIERDGLHREIKRASGHWAVERSYDAAGRLAAWQFNGTGSDSQPAWLRQYQYDATGRPLAIEDSRFGLIGYRYDAAGRLIGSRHGEHEHRYGFDPAGNRLSRIHAEPSQSWAAEVRARLPDRAFNVLRQHHGGQRGWPDNRVLELDGSRYAYDALGRRIRKEVAEPDGSSTTRFGWEGDRQVAEDIDGQLTRTTIYEPQSFVPLARIEMRQGSGEAEDDGEDAAEATMRAMLGQVKHMLLGAGLGTEIGDVPQYPRMRVVAWEAAALPSDVVSL